MARHHVSRAHSALLTMCAATAVSWLHACRYLQLLASQQQPFSFQQEEAEAAAAKAAKRAAAHDPNRFQVRVSFHHLLVVSASWTMLASHALQHVFLPRVVRPSLSNSAANSQTYLLGCVVGCLQRQFKAKPVPAHVYEHKHEAMMAAHEAAKLAAKVKADMAKERVQKAIEEDRSRR